MVPVLLALISVSASAQRTTPAITGRDARLRLSIIADDSMRGRRAGDIGNVRATDYIARELKRLGLQPAGENGTYFQTLPLEEMALDTNATLSGNGVTLHIWHDFTVAVRQAAGRQFELDSARVVYGGALGDTLEMIDAAHARGRVVILGPKMVNGVRVPVQRPGFGLGTRFNQSAAIFFAQIDTAMNAADFSSNLNLINDDTTRVRIGGSITETAAEALFGGRKLASLHAGDTGSMVHSTVKIRKSAPAYPTRNVLAVLRGSDPRLATEYVVIGAHPDHVGVSSHPVDHDSVAAFNRTFRPRGGGSSTFQQTPERVAAFHRMLDSLRRVHKPRLDSINNGSDDDGSGTTGLLEIAEAFASAKTAPRRSILFAWFNAEEAGLLGSRQFMAHPTIPLDSVVTELQMDHISRGNAADVAGGNPNLVYLVGAYDISSALPPIVNEANRALRQPLGIDLTWSKNSQANNAYCGSDQWYFGRRGIPVALFFTGFHPDYHQVTDELQYGDPQKLARIAQLVHDVAERIANRVEPLPRDRPGLDVSCRPT